MYGRFDTLKATVDASKAKAYFEEQELKSIPPFSLGSTSRHSTSIVTRVHH